MIARNHALPLPPCPPARHARAGLPITVLTKKDMYHA